MRRLARLMMQALGALRARYTYALLMMIGIVIGISSVTVIYEIGQGVRVSVLERMASMGFGSEAFMVMSGGGFRGFGRRRGGGAQLTLTMEDVKAIAQQENVALVSPGLRVRRTRVSANGNHANTRVEGSTPNWTVARNWPVSVGRFFSELDLRKRTLVAVLGSSTARELFPDGNPLGKLMRIGNTPFKVIGVLVSKGSSPGGHDFDDRIIVPLTTAQRRLMNEDKIRNMRVNMIDPSNGPQTVANVSALLRSLHKLPAGAPDDFTIVTSEALLNMITRQSQGMVFMLTFISAVSLFVSGIVIMNIMLVAVSERSYEIGVRRAVGAKRSDIMLQILFESCLVGLTGGALGLALGLGVARLFSIFWELPTALNPLNFLLAFSFSTGVGLVFGVLPARRAAGLAVVEALR